MRMRLRELHAGGRTFVWRAEIFPVSGEGDCHRCIRVRVWGAGKNSQVLQADLLSKSWGTPWSACATDGAYPSVRDVRAIVDYALVHGWEPDHVGGKFLLTEKKHAGMFELADFLLTDRLGDSGAPDPTVRVVHAFTQHPSDEEAAATSMRAACLR